MAPKSCGTFSAKFAPSGRASSRSKAGRKGEEAKELPGYQITRSEKIARGGKERDADKSNSRRECRKQESEAPTRPNHLDCLQGEKKNVSRPTGVVERGRGSSGRIQVPAGPTRHIRIPDFVGCTGLATYGKAAGATGRGRPRREERRGSSSCSEREPCPDAHRLGNREHLRAGAISPQTLSNMSPAGNTDFGRTNQNG